MSFSGGVSEYIAGRTTSRYGDLGLDLARALNDARASGALTAESIELEHGIRATVLGASQFSVQVSGNTISVSSAAILPLRNLPVVAARVDAPWPAPEQVCGAIEQALRRLDLTAHDERTVALSLSWAGDASYRVLLALAQGVHAALPRAGAASHRWSWWSIATSPARWAACSPTISRSTDRSSSWTGSTCASSTSSTSAHWFSRERGAGGGQVARVCLISCRAPRGPVHVAFL